MRSRDRADHGDSVFEDSFYNVDESSPDSRRSTASRVESTTTPPIVTTASRPVSVQSSSVTHQAPSRPTVIHTATNRPVAVTGRPVILPQASVEDDDGSFYNLDVPMTELGSRVPTQHQPQVTNPTANVNNVPHAPAATDGWLRNEFNSSTYNMNSSTGMETLTPANRAMLGSLTPAEINEIDALYGISPLIQLVEMGFPPEHCRMALKQCDGDLSRATIFCLEHGPDEMQWLMRAEANRIARAASETVDVEPTRTKPKKGLFQRLFASKSKATPTPNAADHAQAHGSDGHGTQQATNRPLSTPVTVGHHPQPVVAGGATVSPAAANITATSQSRTRAQTTTTIPNNTSAASRPITTPNPHNHPVPQPLPTASQQQQQQQRSQAQPPLQQQHRVEPNVHYPPPMNPNFVDIPPSHPSHVQNSQPHLDYSNQHNINHQQNQHDFDDFDQPIPEIMQPPTKAKGGAKKAATAAPASLNSRPTSVPVQRSPDNASTNQSQSHNRTGQQQSSPHHDHIRPDPYGMRGYGPAPAATTTTAHKVASSSHTPQTTPKPASASPASFAPTAPTVTSPTHTPTPGTPMAAQPSPTIVNPPSGSSSPHPRLAHALLDLPSTSHYGSLMNIDAILQEQSHATAASTHSEVPIPTTSTVASKPEPASMPPSKPPRPISMKLASARFDDGSDMFGNTALPPQATSNFGLDIPTFGTGDSGFAFGSEPPKPNDAVVFDKTKTQLPHNPHYYDSAAAQSTTAPAEQTHQSYFGSILFSEPFSLVENEAFSEPSVPTTAVEPEFGSFTPTVKSTVNVGVDHPVEDKSANMVEESSHIPVIIDSNVEVPSTVEHSETTVPEVIVSPSVSMEAVSKVPEEDSAVTDTESPVERAVKVEQQPQSEEVSVESHANVVHVDQTDLLVDMEPFVEPVPEHSISPDTHFAPQEVLGEAVITQTATEVAPMMAEETSAEAVAHPEGHFFLFSSQDNDQVVEEGLVVEQPVEAPAATETGELLDIVEDVSPVDVTAVSHDEPLVEVEAPTAIETGELLDIVEDTAPVDVNVVSRNGPLVELEYDMESTQEPVVLVHDEQLIDVAVPVPLVNDVVPEPNMSQEGAFAVVDFAPTEPSTQAAVVAVDDVVPEFGAVINQEPVFDQFPEEFPLVDAAVAAETHGTVDDAFQIPSVAVAEAVPHDGDDDFQNFTPVDHSSSEVVEAEIFDATEPVTVNTVPPTPLQLVPPSTTRDIAPAAPAAAVPAVALAASAAVTPSPSAAVVSSNIVESRPPVVLDRNHPPHLNSMDNMLPTINIAAHSVIVADEVPDRLHPVASPTVVGEQNGQEVISSSAATTARISLLRKRQLQPYRVEPLRSGKFRAYVSLKQPYLKKNETSPQGNRPDEVILGDCANEVIARDLCECFAPPIWQSKALHAANAASNTCTLCQVSFSMFSKPHHCRNCGFLICGNCSDKFWPGTMLPETFHDDEKMVRVCHSCHYLVENFVVALCAGDYQTVRALYATGNINLHQPYSVYTHQAYPIHYAVLGGNLDVLRWLVDIKRCSIINQLLKAPLVTQSGWTLLGLAAYCGHVDMVHFLVHQKKCQISEIKEVITLQRAMHALLRVPGNMPAFVLNQKTNPLPSSTLHALQDDLLLMLRHHPQLRSQTLTTANVNSANAGNDAATMNSSTHSSNNNNQVGFTDSSHHSSHVSAATASAVPVSVSNQAYIIPSATAQEAPVIVASSTIEPAPIQINLLGIQTQVNVTVNSITQATLTKPLPKTRCLCSQAVFRVEEFLENQRRTMFYTLPPTLQHTHVPGNASDTTGSAANSTRNSSTSISGLPVSLVASSNSTGDVVALASPVGGYPLTAATAQHDNNVALAAMLGASTGSNRSTNSAQSASNTSGHSTPVYVTATAAPVSPAPMSSNTTLPAGIASSHRSANTTQQQQQHQTTPLVPPSAATSSSSANRHHHQHSQRESAAGRNVRSSTRSTHH